MVTTVKPGDPVILSFNSCGECYSCADNHPAYCVKTIDCNWKGLSAMYTTTGESTDGITGSFFGQSSFTNRAIVRERSIVSLAGLNVTRDEIKVLAPLGCGIQTGTGAFINITDVQSNEDVAVLGVGSVGQSAIMVYQLSLSLYGSKLTSICAGCVNEKMYHNSGGRPE